MAEAFFQATAWTMDTPKPYGAFHLVLTVLGVSLSIFLARKFSFPERKAGPDTILFLCGLFLGLTELYKQGFIYYIENGRTYDWWYFPFQLCSIPMYICLAAPLLHSEKHFAAPPPSFRISGCWAESWPWLYRQDSCIRTGR